MTDSNPQTPTPPEPPVVHVDALPPGTRLDEFEVLSLLGVGGFGMVYRAYDHSLQRTVAIKEYMPAALTGRADGLSVSVRSSADQPGFLAGLKSFVAEARLLARFDHPSLVKVYRFWEANNTAYMAMPLYSGMTLTQARGRMRGPPPEAWLRKVLWSILEALKVLHENKTVHRDISPDNIFLQDVGPPVLLDLGAARRTIGEMRRHHTAVLKVNYAPIEQYAQAEDLSQGPWTDLYSVAALVHGCLCNEPPLPATSRVVRDQMPAFAAVAKTVEAHFGLTYSSGFVSAISHALAIEPGERPQSIQEFALEMSLQAPDGMLKFDWRAELPDGTLSPGGRPGEAPAQTPALAGATVDLDVDWPSTLMPDAIDLTPGKAPEPGGRPKSRKAALLVAAAVLLSGLAFLGLRTGPRTADAELSKPVAPANSRAALPEPAGSAKPTPAPETPKTVAPPSKTGPAAGASPAEPRKAVPAPVAPKPHATANRQASAALCADSNFITRPMCIHLECQKPQYRDLAVCIEDHRRYPDKSN